MSSIIQQMAYNKKREKKKPVFTGASQEAVMNPGIAEALLFAQSELDPKKEKALTPQERVQAEQGNVLSSMEKSKISLKERAPFLMGNPDKPEFDAERAGKYKQLAKTGAIAQLIDSLADVGLGARNKDYQPVPTNAGDLSIDAYNNLYGMDEEFRADLGNYKDQLFATGEQNKRIGAEIDQKNEQTDVAMAQQRLGFAQDDARVEAAKEKLKYDSLDDTKKWYFDSGLRLISQGQEEAGLSMLTLAGMNTKEAKALLGGKNSGEAGEPTVISRINQFLGYDGKNKSISNLEISLIKQQRELEKTVTDADYDFMGKPQTKAAKDLEAMNKELGILRFVPDDLLVEDAFKSATGTVGEKGIVIPEASQKEAMVNENKSIVQSLTTQQLSDAEQKQLLAKFYQNSQQMGMSEEEIEKSIKDIFDPQSQYNQSQQPKESSNVFKNEQQYERFNRRFAGVQDITDENQAELAAKKFNEIGLIIADSKTDPKQKEEAIEDFTLALLAFGYDDEAIPEIMERIVNEQSKSSDLKMKNFQESRQRN